MSDSPFPLRVAAIDVGTNAIRFVAAEFVDATHWVEIEYQRVPVRLGHHAFLTGRLEESASVTAVRALLGEGELVLEVDGRGDLLLEQWALKKKARMFETVYGLPVRLTVPEPSLGPGVI